MRIRRENSMGKMFVRGQKNKSAVLDLSCFNIIRESRKNRVICV